MKYKSCIDYWIDTSNYTFRGEFDEMYRDIDDPWNDEKAIHALDNRLFLEILAERGKYRRILDIGCGLGGFADHIRRRLCVNEIIGCDVASTAIEKARTLYPKVEFRCVNIITDEISTLGDFDLIIMSRALWYILKGVKGVFEKISKSLTLDGLFGFHQHFPDEQHFGREVIDGFQGFERFLSSQTPFEYCTKVIRYFDGIVLYSILKKR